MWIIFSILAGLGDAIRDAAAKKAAERAPRLLIAWAYVSVALPFFLPALFRGPEGELDSTFWIYLLIMSLLHVVGNALLVSALRMSELSLCLPIISFSPVFMLVVAPLVTGDVPNAYGVGGTFLVITGSYLLNLDSMRSDLLAPLRALFYHKGARMMLATAFIWSLTSALDKVAIPRYGLGFWAAAQLLGITVLFLPLLFLSKETMREVRETPREALLMAVLPVGLLNALSFLLYLGAVPKAPVLYVICLKRLSILFALIIGKIFFQEKVTLSRAVGATIMLAGVIIISLRG